MKRTLLILSTIVSIGASAQIPTAGMIAGYDFLGNANDVSGNGHNGSVIGATLTTSRNGTPNGAYRFNGYSNYIQVPSTPTLTPSAQITMCAEVKVEGFYVGTCQNNAIICKVGTSGYSGFYFLGFSDNPYDNDWCSLLDTTKESFIMQLKNDITTSGAQDYTPYIVKNQWYCVISTFDGSDAKLYVDGTLKVTVHATAALGSNTGDLTFGRHLSTSLPYWFMGVIDDIRIYNRVLTNTEIQNYCTALVGVDEAGSIESHVRIANLGDCMYELKLDKAFNKVQVTVISTLGQSVYASLQSNSANHIVDLSNFAKGMYLVNVVTEEGTFTTKIVKE